MKRRQFLVLTAGGIAIAGAGAGAGLWLFCPAREEPTNARRQLIALAESLLGVAAVGRAWREAHVQADPEAMLLQSLELDADEVVLHEAFVERLAVRIEADLEQGRIFEHEGWWLAETEARLAALHVAALGPEASEAEDPEFDTAPEGRIVRVERFNPKSMRQGEAITHTGLPDGVIWFATASPPAPRLVVMMAGRQIRISTSEYGFSVRIPDGLQDYLNANPGEHEIWLYDPVTNRRQMLGTFIVREGEPDETGFCPIGRWGPRNTVAGEVFNEQPNGAAAFWVRIACFPEDTVLVMDGVELPTTLRPADGLITAHVADTSLYEAPGEYAIELLDRQTGNTQPVGPFVVSD